MVFYYEKQLNRENKMQGVLFWKLQIEVLRFYILSQYKPIQNWHKSTGNSDAPKLHPLLKKKKYVKSLTPLPPKLLLPITYDSFTAQESPGCGCKSWGWLCAHTCPSLHFQPPWLLFGTLAKQSWPRDPIPASSSVSGSLCFPGLVVPCVHRAQLWEQKFILPSYGL